MKDLEHCMKSDLMQLFDKGKLYSASMMDSLDPRERIEYMHECELVASQILTNVRTAKALFVMFEDLFEEGEDPKPKVDDDTPPEHWRWN